jgi:hypothetical protein
MFFKVYVQIFSEKCMFINEDLDLIGNKGTTDCITDDMKS